MSINISNQYIPCDTKNLLPRKIEQNEFKNYNFALIYRLPNIFIEKGQIKIRINEKIEKFNWDREFIKNLTKRLERSIQGVKELGYEVKKIDNLTLSWRMVIGLGASHPQETSMTLHHIYGIPYIPGCAVKGVTRHWVILTKFENDEKKAEQDNDFQKIFGTQEKQGEVIFFDAYPVDEIKLKLDIMNPHYPKYYSGEQPPADWQTPVPIYFLTVEKTKFNFYLASRDKNLLNNAEKYLKEALKSYGIGAKTSLGYGIFEG
ncbi:MAG: CRISPR-associated protein Cmr6 [Petrotoga sp.]|uniref:Type III-B CRISPR module RAMP protein Cmr6 n=1 Tax=Thermodesulfobacterium commune TaxID=1741 RepID=A0A3B8N2W2_9BACT|nr:type III-B CRISPR module RAMP protein Cmr6 [Thermodesulfobacterium thermophilum]MDK2811985.1 CRISPR-associated protein Cmr6 [Petrotoga sp.]HAA83492.1 type III-B CRISPR module RAMP protein Cmr6 [Thermodesulfobacterium commune]HCP10099.1 type III-B CRISPR module RAMP protein Cmr6 [Thermodesulfobacterium commune]